MHDGMFVMVINNPASEASAVTNCANMRFLVYMYVAVRPFGPARAPRNALRANVGPAGRGSMVNIITLKTPTLVLSRG